MAGRPIDPQLANAIAKRVQIENIRLIKSRTYRDMLDDSAIPNEVDISYSAKLLNHEFDKKSSAISVVVAFLAFGKPHDDTVDQHIFRVESSFALNYSLHGEEEVTDEQLDAFARLNGVYNAWPYWREFVQSSVGRMGLSPVVLPVLTVASIAKMMQKDEDKDSDESKEAGAVTQTQ